MGFFKFGKNNDVVDLGERYRKQQEKVKSSESESSEEIKSQENASPFGFFDMSNTPSTNQNQTKDEEGEVLDLSDSIGERRKKLSKRILDMTSKMEDLGNQVYHLQQRIEVLEKKLDVNRFD